MIETCRTETFRGLETSWLEEGDPSGPILLFLHGFPDSPETWDAQVASFRSHFRVIRPYARGAHPSRQAARLGRYGTDSGALDMLQLLAVLDPREKKPIYCIGHDLGAVHAWHLASLLGRRLQRLVLINGLGLAPMITRWNRFKQHRLSWYIYAMQVPGLAETMLRLFPRRTMRLAHDLGCLPPEKRPRGENPRDYALHPLNQYRQFVREIPKTLNRTVPRLSTPLLLLWGSRDAFLLPPTVEEWAPFAADVTVRILPAGHWVHREKADEVNRILNQFFGQRSDERSGHA